MMQVQERPQGAKLQGRAPTTNTIKVTEKKNCHKKTWPSRLILAWEKHEVNVHDRLGGKASVHDRLGGRVNEESNDSLEEIADSLVPDEDIMCRAPEHQRTLQLDNEGSSQTHKSPIHNGVHNGVQMAWPSPRKGEFSAYVS
jgi:hypothetical protein